MNVASILNEKGSAVVTIGSAEPVTRLLQVLNEKRIGAVVVLDDRDRVVGMISERDIVTTLAEKGHAGLDAQVSDLMTRDPVTCRKSDTVDHLMALMTSRRVRHLPVIEDGKLCGLVSIGDIVKHKIAETEMEADALKRYIATG